MTENPFLVSFGTYSNIELYRILLDEEQYQPGAVNAARQVLHGRNLSEEEWNQLKKEVQHQPYPTYENRGMNRVKRKTKQLGDKLNPFYKTGVDKDISLIIISISFLLLFSLITGYDVLLDLLAGFSFSSTSIMLLFPYFFVSIGLFYFYRRDPLGWIILFAWTSYSFLTILLYFLYSLFEQQIIFFVPVDHTTLVGTLIVFGSLWFAVIRRPVRAAFRISSIMLYTTLLLAAGFSALLFFK